MTANTNKPASSNWWKWFDFRARDAGTWAFILNRVTGLGLALYLFLHLIVLGQLAQGPQAWENFLKTMKSPLFMLGEFLVIVAGIYHGLNGIRIGLTVFGNSTAVQKQIFYVVLAITVIGTVFFAYRMFS